MSDQEENEDFEAGEAEDTIDDIMDQVIGVPLTKGQSNLTVRRQGPEQTMFRYDGKGTQSFGKGWKWQRFCIC